MSEARWWRRPCFRGEQGRLLGEWSAIRSNQGIGSLNQFRFAHHSGASGSLNAGTRIATLLEVPHLEQQAIPHATIPNCTNHFSVVNTLGESELDSACSIEGFQLFGGEFHIQTGEIVLELRYLPRSYDRDYWHRLMAQPGECDLRHAATGLFGNRLYSRYHRRRALFPLRKEVFHSLIGHPPAVVLAFAVIFPG